MTDQQQPLDHDTVAKTLFASEKEAQEHIARAFGSYRHPGWKFSGANMGGESMQVCEGCGAMVKDSDTARHVSWHNRLGF